MEEDEELKSLREELENLGTVAYSQNDVEQHNLVALARIQAYTYASAMNTAKILAHLKGEDTDEAVKKQGVKLDKAIYRHLIQTAKNAKGS